MEKKFERQERLNHIEDEGKRKEAEDKLKVSNKKYFQNADLLNRP